MVSMKRLLFFLALLASATGCMEMGYYLFGVGSTESRRMPKKTPSEIWNALQETVNEYFDIRLADDEEKYLETEWNEHLGPMYKMGRRLRVRAWVKMDEDQLAPFIEICVDREVNTNFEKPLSKSEADWEPDFSVDGRDQSREILLLQMVRMRLYKITPSDEVLSPKPSPYRQDPESKQSDELWGSGDGPAPGGKSDDLWRDGAGSRSGGSRLWR